MPTLSQKRSFRFCGACPLGDTGLSGMCGACLLGDTEAQGRAELLHPSVSRSGGTQNRDDPLVSGTPAPCLTPPQKHILGGCSGQGRLVAGAGGGNGAGRVRAARKRQPRPPCVAGLGDWRAVILLEVRLRQGTSGQQEAQPVLTTVLTARAPCSERRLPLYTPRQPLSARLSAAHQLTGRCFTL